MMSLSLANEMSVMHVSFAASFAPRVTPARPSSITCTVRGLGRSSFTSVLCLLTIGAAFASGTSGSPAFGAVRAEIFEIRLLSSYSFAEPCRPTWISAASR